MEQFWILLSAYLFIFVARVIDMSLDVIRILMLTKGRKVAASIVGFFEISVFIVALNEVLKGGLDDPGKILAYASGFAMGNFVGSMIEERLAMGYVSVQVFPPPQLSQRFVTVLRQEGFGVTTVTGMGRDGERIILFLMLKRKDAKKALNILDEIYPNVFYNISDATRIRGGVFPSRKGK